MKIFMSHSGHQKLFVKELRRRLSTSVSLWIDEREMHGGDRIDDTLQTAVQSECELFIAVIDYYAARSQWVAKELGWALERERTLGRTFLLPIVLDLEAFATLPAEIRAKRFLSCPDQSEQSLEALARVLESDITSWLAHQFDSRGAKPTNGRQVIEQADRYVNGLADEIRTILFPHRERNPLPLASLLDALRNRLSLDIAGVTDLADLIERMRNLELLVGVTFDGQEIFLSQENYSFKAALHLPFKNRIARAALAKLTSKMTFAVDGGSTTLEFIRLLATRLKSRAISDLRMVTNSLPVANEVLATLARMGAADRDKLIEVYVLGGRCRHTSMTVIPHKTAPDSESMAEAQWAALFSDLGSIDCAFLGANGLYRGQAFANHTSYELPAKRAMAMAARQRYILVDPSKLDVEQELPFAYFSDGLTVITASSSAYADAIARLQSYAANTPSRVEVA